MNAIDFLNKTSNNDLKQIIVDYDLKIDEFNDLEKEESELEDYPTVTYKNKFYEVVIEFDNVYIYYKNKIEFRKNESIYYLRIDGKFQSHGLNTKLSINSCDVVFNNIITKNKFYLFYWSSKLLK